MRIRQFSIDSHATMKAIRALGETEVTDGQGNKICTSGLPEHYIPCFETAKNAPDMNDPLKIAQIASWPLAFPNMKVKGDSSLSRPPAGCTNCCSQNSTRCLTDDACIFSVSNARFIRPQFVFLGKNWSADIVNHKVDHTCWRNGNNIQAKHLKNTIFEGGYFTDFVKGLSKTNFSDMSAWLLKEDPLFNGRLRFDVYLEVFEQELALLRTKFNLQDVDKYIVVWGVGILTALDKVTNKLYGHSFAQHPYFKDNNYKVGMFGVHYSSQGKVLDSLRGLDNPENRTVRRIYESVEARQNDNDFDHQGFDFEIMPDQKVLLPNGQEEKIEWLS